MAAEIRPRSPEDMPLLSRLLSGAASPDLRPPSPRVEASTTTTTKDFLANASHRWHQSDARRSLTPEHQADARRSLMPEELRRAPLAAAQQLVTDARDWKTTYPRDRWPLLTEVRAGLQKVHDEWHRESAVQKELLHMHLEAAVDRLDLLEQNEREYVRRMQQMERDHLDRTQQLERDSA